MEPKRAIKDYQDMTDVMKLDAHRRAFVIAHNGLEGPRFHFLDWLNVMWDRYATLQGWTEDRTSGKFIARCVQDHKGFLNWLGEESMKEDCYRMNVVEPS